MLRTIPKRSFVIPVLDMSPASPYNIVRLLEDLKEIEGDVIIVFNSIEMAEELKNHSRIDFYCVMNENVGVSRAWNIGLNISQSPVTFILNSDLHLEKETVETLEKYLLEIKDAALVGPQGTWFHFETGKEIQYFEKGSFNVPTQVDAVSGFFFALRTELYNTVPLRFENMFSPCYFEEWDMSLQIKAAGWNSYIIPVTGYSHEWSGTIRSLRTIKYLKNEETADEILLRNKRLFWAKWMEYKKARKDKEHIFISQCVSLILEKAEKLFAINRIEEARGLFRIALEYYSNDASVLSGMGALEYKNNNLAEALSLFTEAVKIDPYCKLPVRLEGLNENPEGSESYKAASSKEKPVEYYENPRQEIQNLVNPAAAGKILDVGCGSGLMAFQLKAKLNAEVWGVEVIKSAALKAQERLDKVISGEIESAVNKLPDNYFDTIIFADVLEHLADPYSIVGKMMNKLSANGEILASVPNIRFWPAVRDLLEGNWDYKEAGIMDNSHLRFFTKASAVKMFRNAGYIIKDIYSVKTRIPDLPEELLKALENSGVNVSSLNDESKEFQYIVRVVKA